MIALNKITLTSVYPSHVQLQKKKKTNYIPVLNFCFLVTSVGQNFIYLLNNE